MDAPAKKLSSARSRWMFGCWAVIAVTSALSLKLPALERVEYQLYDAQMRYLRDSGLHSPSRIEAALIGIDERAMSEIEAPFTLWHEQFGQIIRAVMAGEGLILGFDIVLPERSFDGFLGRPHDQQLMTAMVEARGHLPLVFGRTLNAAGELMPVNKRFLGVMGANGFGVVTQVQDRDGVVRRFEDDRFVENLGMNTLVGQMVRALGHPVSSGLIDYSLGASIDYVPVLDVLEWSRRWHEDGDEQALAALKGAFRGQAVFVGSVLSFVDRHFQPVVLSNWGEPNYYAPGVLVQIQAFRSVISDRLIQPASSGLVLLLCALGAAFIFLWDRPVMAPIAVAAFVALVLIVSTYAMVRGIWIPVIPLVSTSIFGWLVATVLNALESLRERKRIKGSFAGYVSPAVLDKILDGSINPEMDGETRSLCVLFADIRGFTTLSESMPADRVLALLNRYFEQVTPVIHRHGGTLDKYLGDGIMALFGAPQNMDDAVESALKAAKAMHGVLDDLNERLAAEDNPTIHIGVGLSYGQVVVGHVGAQSRHEYSAIGDAVNVAARVEGLTRTFDCRIILTDAAACELSEAARQELIPLGIQDIRGHSAIAVHAWGRLDEA